MTTAAPTTIGVAIAVPEPWGTQLQDYRKSLGDQTAQGIPTHITLMPPFEVDVDDLPGIEQHLLEASANANAFRIHLRGTGTFRPVSPVVFVTGVVGLSGGAQLAVAVRRGPRAAHRQLPDALQPRRRHPRRPLAAHQARVHAERLRLRRRRRDRQAHHLADDLLDRAFEELASFDCTFVADRFSMYVHDARDGWVVARDFLLTAAADQ